MPLLACLLFASLAQACVAQVGDENASAGDGQAETLPWCSTHTADAPRLFWASLKNAADYMPHVPNIWGRQWSAQGKCMAKIACRESDWLPHATNGRYKGMYQIDESYFPMGEATFSKYWNGGRDRNGKFRIRRFWQSYAAFRYVLSRPDYAKPCDGWSSELSRNWW